MPSRDAWLVSILIRIGGCSALASLCAACPAGDDSPATSESTSTTDDPTTGMSTSTTSPSTSSASTSSSSTTDESTSTGPGETTMIESASSTTDEPASTGSSSSGGCTPGSEDCVCDAGSCDEGLECTDGFCVNPFGCEEDVDAEPNDDEGSAIEIGDHDCGSLAEMPGNVDNTDVDWWTYHGIADDACGEDTIVIISADEELEVCMYFECDMGNAQVVCAAASDDATSDEGRPGCCGVGSTQYTTTSCLGAATSDSGNIYISVAGPEAGICVAYDIAYRFLD